MKKSGLTTRQLARGLEIRDYKLEKMLAESEAGGIVERGPGGWRLTERAEREFGPVLRGVWALDDEEAA